MPFLIQGIAPEINQGRVYSYAGFYENDVIRDLCQEELNSFHKIGDIVLKGFNVPLPVFKVMKKDPIPVL